MLIELHGDAAQSEAQVLAILIRRNSEPTEVDIVGARYLDKLSRRAGAWRIDRRLVVLDWRKTEVWPATAPAVPIDEFSRGARVPDDLSYHQA